MISIQLKDFQFFTIPSKDDKLILKIFDEETVMLAFTGLSPSFISLNANMGRIQCEKFFPDGFENSAEEEEQEEGDGVQAKTS